MQNLGKIVFIAGIVIAAIGLVVWLLGNKLNWFGNLPGDIRIKRDNFNFYAPLTSMIILSVVFSLVIWLIRKNFGE